jgi:ArsR family transcriptional regulator
MDARSFVMTVNTTQACCAPLLHAPLDDDGAAELAAAFKALADPVRLRLLSLIAAAPQGEACSCDLEDPVGKSQPTVSHHLSVLADAGLITKTKVGRWVMCAVVPERLAALRDVLRG